MTTIGFDKLCYATFTEDNRHIQGRLWYHGRLAALIRDSTKPRRTPQIFWRIQAKQNLLARNCINTSRQLVELAGIEPATSSMPWKRATNCAIAPKAKSYLHKPVR